MRLHNHIDKAVRGKKTRGGDLTRIRASLKRAHNVLNILPTTLELMQDNIFDIQKRMFLADKDIDQEQTDLIRDVYTTT